LEWERHSKTTHSERVEGRFLKTSSDNDVIWLLLRYLLRGTRAKIINGSTAAANAEFQASPWHCHDFMGNTLHKIMHVESN
jgi:hypothetical protein